MYVDSCISSGGLVSFNGISFCEIPMLTVKVSNFLPNNLNNFILLHLFINFIFLKMKINKLTKQFAKKLMDCN